MGEKPPRRAGRSAVRRRAGVGGSGRVQAAARSSGRENRVVFHRTRGPERTPYRFFNPIVIAAWARAPLAAPDILRGPDGRTQIEDPPRAGFPEGRHPLLRRHDAAARPGGFMLAIDTARRAVSRRGRSRWSSASRAAASSSERRSPIGSARASCRCARSASCRRTTDPRDLRPRVRHRQPRDAQRRDRPGPDACSIVDDLLATGGTARATVDLVKQLGGDVRGARVPHRAGRR